MNLNDENLYIKINKCDDDRIFALAEGLRRGISKEELHGLTMIDLWFLSGLENIVNMEKDLKNNITDKLLFEANDMGFTDKEVCDLTGIELDEILEMKKSNNISTVYKMVDTCSGEFEAKTPYYYSCFEEEDENIISDNKKILVLGSGPIRIGQGIEFDYCCVHGSWAIKDAGYDSIMINNNPETVSTDFDTSDKLYFESLYIDDVMNIINSEKPEGVIVQLGGQTSVNLAPKLFDRGINILGTSYESMDIAEDRDKFRKFLDNLNIPSPMGESITNLEEAMAVVKKIEYPVVVRPSYVIGGRAMQVVYSDMGLKKYMEETVEASSENPILIDKYVKGIEIEVDAIGDGEDILIPGIMEHIEKTGVHSGDSISVYPNISLSNEVVDKLVKYTKEIAEKLRIIGLINIQYVYDGDKIYVIEVNPRASRTVPILSKVTGVPMVKLAVDAMVGKKLKDTKYGTGLMNSKNFYAVKVPVFSGEKLADVDMSLGPEMKSTGEVLGIDVDLNKAIYKGFVASGIKIPQKGTMYVSLNESDREESLAILKGYEKLGFNILASVSTHNFLKKHDIPCELIPIYEVEKLIKDGQINIMISTFIRDSNQYDLDLRIMRKMIENRLPLFTCIDTARVFEDVIKVEYGETEVGYKYIEEYLQIGGDLNGN
jgi:carbamoyl-phosphate synthase large subunit